MGKYHGVGYQPSEESDTSEDAAKSIKDLVKNQRRRAWKFVEGRGVFGATAQETNTALGIKHNCCSRFTELRQLGRLARNGSQRKTETGRYADVHVAIPRGEWTDKREGWPSPRKLSKVQKLQHRIKYLEDLLTLNCLPFND